jgi:hypothetical protein
MDAVRVQYHSWGVKPIMEGGEIKGVVFESKEGRKAVLARIVIDATETATYFGRLALPIRSLPAAGRAPARRPSYGGSEA